MGLGKGGSGTGRGGSGGSATTGANTGHGAGSAWKPVAHGKPRRKDCITGSSVLSNVVGVQTSTLTALPAPTGHTTRLCKDSATPRRSAGTFLVESFE